MLASALREGGRAVLAKTTGSEPCLVLPDGSVERIARRGPPSILEQKRLVHRGARLGVDALVAEVMSIHAENHLVEGRRILIPHLVLVTNLRVDHTAAGAGSPDEVAALLALGVPAGATVLVPEAECLASLRAPVERAGGRVIAVPAGTAASVLEGSTTSPFRFGENADLVVAAGRALGLDDPTLARGVERARHDVGALRVWRVPGDGGSPPAYLVSAFAANDPDSSLRAYDRVVAALHDPAGPHLGLLCLRADRGDRTVQWADALRAGALDRCRRVFVTGRHAAALERRVRRAGPRPGAGRPPPIEVLRPSSAPALTRFLVSGLEGTGGIVLGLGNLVGTGETLVAHWSRIGDALPHGR
jgi:poly-gamma-glutamate synthase PgsB/CapB